MMNFRGFRLDTVNLCLWRGEMRVSLAPKAFDVLRYLAEHADRLVTQDEILEALWPETYVNPEVVKKYVLGIRKVLGDRSNKPVFVATFPRRGYQFIAPIIDDTAPPNPEVSATVIKTIVGRESALAQLDSSLKKALQGQRQIVFITGEAGIGKTTLVDVFLKRAAFGVDVRIARGQCAEGFGGKETYYPILEALGQLFRHPDDCPNLQTFSLRAPTWLVQFPNLVKDDQRDALEKEIIGATRERMVREICEALETITAKNPLVLCLEDLHWVDPSTLDFISALARRRGPAKLLILGTYRPADVIISQSPLKALKQDLVIHNLSNEIGLERLEESDVAEYLDLEFAKANFPAGLANVIYRHSGGNALFMVTIVQDMVKKGLIAKTGGVWKLKLPLEKVDPSVPETLDQLIEAQFQQLSAVEQRILRCASVAGERFSVWAISTVAELDPGIIEDACEGLVERLQFIKPAGIHELANGEDSAHYEFRHSLYREVLYRRLSEVSRSKLHQLLAQRLEVLCEPCEQELATELALHFEEGRDYEQATQYLILAAQNAARRFAYRDSIEILQHCLGLAEKLNAALRAKLEIQILELIGDAHFALGSMRESAEAYRATALRADQAGLKTALVRALTCAMCPLGFIDPDRGIAAIERAVEESAGLDDPLLLARTQMMAASSRLIFDTWRHQDAELCASTHETLQRLGDLGTSPFQRMTHAHVLILRGNYREALEIFESGISRTDRSINLIAHFIANSGKTLTLLRTGNFGEVLRITRAGREFAEENLARSWLLSLREAWLRTLVFDFKGALKICETIDEPTAEDSDGQPATIGRIAAGNMALEQGKFGDAIRLFGRVSEPVVSAKFFLHWFWRIVGQLELSNAWLLSGNIMKARTAAARFHASALSTADPHLQALAWELQTRVAMAENDWAAAREHIQKALAISDKFEILVAAWQVHGTAWRLFSQLNDSKTAESHRERAEACILKIANSFESEEPLRASFLAAAPVRSILHEKVVTSALRPQESSRSVGI
jgi:DNA-binding winged helix-turn-helix (wHTH) protein/tetratricopeptide (TPR) repeat protein